MRVLLCICLGLAFNLSSCTKKNVQEPPIKLGVLLTVSGVRAVYGEKAKSGIELATEEVNAAGGIHNRPIQIIIRDAAGTPEGTIEAIKALIQTDHVAAIVGETSSTRTLAAAPLAQAAHVPLVSPSATNQEVTAIGHYIFRACFVDSFQGFVMAHFAFQSLGIKRVAILFDEESTYSKGLVEIFKKEFIGLTGTVVAEQSYKNSEKKFETQLAEIKKRKPEALFIPGTQDDIRVMAPLMRSMGMRIPLLGSDSWDHPDIFIGTEGVLEPAYFSSHFVTDEFKNKYFSKKGEYPNTFTALSYDAAQLVFEAMKKAPELKGELIQEALSKTFLFHGATGQISFDKKRETKKPAMVWQIKGQKFVPATKIYPNESETSSYRQ